MSNDHGSIPFEILFFVHCSLFIGYWSLSEASTTSVVNWVVRHSSVGHIVCAEKPAINNLCTLRRN